MVKKKIKLENVTNELVSALFSIMTDHKGMNTIHYSGMENYLCRDILITTTMSNRHAETIAEYLGKYLKENNIYFNSSLNTTAENISTDWIVIDCLQIMIHMMVPSKREYYNIDALMLEIGGKKITVQEEEELQDNEIYTLDHVVTKEE
jgi:ribosome silencing factor RsfS/YbeB/iojap